MTAPKHHPSEDLIVDFARGALEPGRAMVMQAHIDACPICRGHVGFAEAVGGALIDEIEPAEMTPDALAQALARLDAPLSPPPATAPRPPDDWIRVPADVVAAAERSRRKAAPGVWVAPISGGSGRFGRRSYLLGIGPGIAVPRHTHKGGEFVCILKGAYTDRGETYQAGDFIESGEDVEHEPRVMGEGECVCLVACDNQLVPRSLIAWLFQPFVGI